MESRVKLQIAESQLSKKGQGHRIARRGRVRKSPTGPTTSSTMTAINVLSSETRAQTAEVSLVATPEVRHGSV